MRPIKFRGRVPGKYKRDGGRIVYGSLVDYGEGVVPYRYWIHPIGSYDYFPVDEDSIAQLVGYDKAGNEVYEGDYVYVRTNSGGTTFKPATMIDIHLVNNYTLKGGDDNGGA